MKIIGYIIGMKKLAVFTVLILFIAGTACSKDYEIREKAGEYDVEVKIDKNPPVVGDNIIKIDVKDASGHLSRDAKVVVEYSMPAMPGMPAMNYKADADLMGDAYTAKMNLSAAGSWNVAIIIVRAGKTSTMKFTVDAK